MTTYGLLIFDGAEELDFAGPWEVFTVSAMQRGQGDTAVLIAEQAGPVRCAKGMRVLPDHTLDDHPPLDVLLVPGGIGTRREVANPVLTGWIARAASQASWVSSVCTGCPAAARGRPGPWPPGGHPPCVRGHAARPGRDHRGPGRPLRGGRERGHQPGRVGRDRHGALARSASCTAGTTPGRSGGYIQYEPAPPYLADEPLAPLAG